MPEQPTKPKKLTMVQQSIEDARNAPAFSPDIALSRYWGEVDFAECLGLCHCYYSLLKSLAMVMMFWGTSIPFFFRVRIKACSTCNLLLLESWA